MNKTNVLCILLMAYASSGAASDLCDKAGRDGLKYVSDGVRCVAATISGEVVSIADGDTLTLLSADKVQHKLRLAYIDAPESKQAYGRLSREKLSASCFRKMAVAAVVSRDRYGRQVAIVSCSGVNVNRLQVERGLAWVYTDYAPKTTDWKAYELMAMREKKGLWLDGKPVEPWVFRRQKRGG